MWEMWSQQQQIQKSQGSTDVQVPRMMRQEVAAADDQEDVAEAKREAEKTFKTAVKAAESAALKAAKLAAAAGLDYTPPQGISVDTTSIAKVDMSRLERQVEAVNRAQRARRAEGGAAGAGGHGLGAAPSDTSAQTQHQNAAAATLQRNSSAGSQGAGGQRTPRVRKPAAKLVADKPRSQRRKAAADSDDDDEDEEEEELEEEPASPKSRAKGGARSKAKQPPAHQQPAQPDPLAAFNQPSLLAAQMQKPMGMGMNPMQAQYLAYQQQQQQHMFPPGQHNLQQQMQLQMRQMQAQLQQRNPMQQQQQVRQAQANSDDDADAWERPPEPKLLLKPRDIRDSLAGVWLQVHWPDDNKWWPGQVCDVNTRTRKAVLLYETNEEEEVDLAELIRKGEVAWLHKEDAPENDPPTDSGTDSDWSREDSAGPKRKKRKASRGGKKQQGPSQQQRQPQSAQAGVQDGRLPAIMGQLRQGYADPGLHAHPGMAAYQQRMAGPSIPGHQQQQHMAGMGGGMQQGHAGQGLSAVFSLGPRALGAIVHVWMRKGSMDAQGEWSIARVVDTAPDRGLVRVQYENGAVQMLQADKEFVDFKVRLVPIMRQQSWGAQ